MIKLTRPQRPADLTDQLQQELTEKFKTDGSHVWKQKFIIDALLLMSHGKCCFCECRLGEEGKYMEVEHFAHKIKYPDQVVQWENLLPSCKRCNLHKSVHDVISEPIINPCVDNPREHFKFHLYRFCGTSSLGSTSEEVLQLNDTEKMVKVRFKIGEKAQDSLVMVRRILESLINPFSVRERNRIHGKIKAILREGLPESDYSATVATVISTDTNYFWIKSRLSQFGEWDEELSDLDKKVCANKY